MHQINAKFVFIKSKFKTELESSFQNNDVSTFTENKRMMNNEI